ncbi:MAG TPA: hypothetical protein VLM76_10625 [Patescibacteria group bacterium]|nr:hypothetical protein [Patescibacteria group bacterium]
MTETIDTADPLRRLTRRDATDMARGMSREAIRNLTDLYYAIQDFRIQAAGQVRSAGDTPARGQERVYRQMEASEGDIKLVMEEWVKASRVGRWALGQVGIGPVLAAGCVATFDPERPTVGSWWRFAGLDPTLEWRKGEKRPYSASAKVLAWKIGDSFVRQSGHEGCIYGRWYRERKLYELERDGNGGHAAAAADTLAAGRIRDKATVATYETGHLPAGRLDLRARRWTAKLFLAHLHWVAWEDAHGSPPPAPYAIDILRHAHLIAPPGWPCE